jgi:hypothetical protein
VRTIQERRKKPTKAMASRRDARSIEVSKRVSYRLL